MHLLKLGQTRVLRSQPHAGLPVRGRERHVQMLRLLQMRSVLFCFSTLTWLSLPIILQAMLPITCDVNINKMEAADDACVEFHTTGATDTAGSKVMGLQFDAGRPKRKGQKPKVNRPNTGRFSSGSDKRRNCQRCFQTPEGERDPSH